MDHDERDRPHSREARFLTEARAAAIQTAVQHLRAIDRLKNGARNPRCSPVVDHGAPQPPGDLLFDLASLQLHGYERLLALTNKYADSFVDRLRHMARRPDGPSVGRPLCIRGTPGSLEHDEFHVANHTRWPVTVCFKISEARDENGCRPFPMGASIQSSHSGEDCADGWPLAPYEKRAFRFTVRLDPPFEAGRRYFAEIDVVMRGRLVEQLPVEIEVRSAKAYP